MFRLSLLLVSLLATLFAASASPANAEGIEVRSQSATNRFPDGIQFRIFLASDANITNVRFHFRILPDGVNATARTQCTTGTVVDCSATVGSTRANYMVPGAQLVYSWEVEDANGAKLVTPEATATYQDDRFNWESISEGNITVYYYFGDVESQRSVLRVARETIDRISDLLNTQVNFPIKIWVYRSAAEMTPAVASRRGQGPGTSVQTLGEVAASDTALVSRDTDFLNIVRHELAHIVTGAATRNHIAGIPTWVNEGISTFAQNRLLPDEEQALSLAIQRNRVLPITSLDASARGSPGAVSLFYGQSGALVAFLVNTHGPDKFGDFVAALANDTTDGALMKVYGFDQLGLENAWRKSLGLPEVSVSQGGASGSQPPPTLVPFGAGQQGQPTPPAGGRGGGQQSGAEGEDDSSGPDLVPVVAGVLALAALTAGAVYLQRRRRPAA